MSMLIAAALLALAPSNVGLPSYRSCLWQQMTKLDDGKTAVDVMATTIEASCRRQYLDLARSNWAESDAGVENPRPPSPAELRARLESERGLLIERIKLFRADADLK